jgi:hypothetical protein
MRPRVHPIAALADWFYGTSPMSGSNAAQEMSIVAFSIRVYPVPSAVELPTYTNSQ